ncbi:hypothetical protein K461DRAFT_318512 [Myriangium duriaei CBS 260.36]|uniref:Apple domain-containing protein n=1 Tax=Myriangium duriaei CBS 260.36 TaxID=1168546 RepID=A0A9P4J5L1_9PEZI|nr:hypothetical protein K461DRAFT_318512 [Myriangium duriaei CBS 260.36]
MRVTDLALPILAGVASINAQGLNFKQILAAEPGIANIRPLPSSKSQSPAQTAAAILSYMASKGPTSTGSSKPTTAAQTSTHTTVKTGLVTSVKPTTTTTKKSTTTTTTKKATTTTTTSKKGAAASSPAKKVARAPVPNLVERQAASSVPCATQSSLYTGLPVPNTATGFLTDTVMSGIAANAVTPPGYSQVFNSLNGSANGIGWYRLQMMATYDVAGCAAICNSDNNCNSFNIYFERDPLLDPGTTCPNPDALVTVRCVMWTQYVSAYITRNYGQWRNSFVTLITGSNGYWQDNVPTAVAGFNTPVSLPGLVNVNTLNGVNPLVGTAFYTGSYNASLCTNLCTQTTASNRAAALAKNWGLYQSCNFVDAAQVSIQGTIYGTYCSMYTTGDVAAGAVQNNATYNGVVYDISNSYGFTLGTADTGIIPGLPTTTTTTTTAAKTTSTSSLSTLKTSSATTTAAATTTTTTKSTTTTTTSTSTTTTTTTTKTTTTTTTTTTTLAATSTPFYLQMTGNSGNSYNNLYLMQGSALYSGYTYYYLTPASSKSYASKFYVINTSQDLVLYSDPTQFAIIQPSAAAVQHSIMGFFSQDVGYYTTPNFGYSGTALTATSPSSSPMGQTPINTAMQFATCSGSGDTPGIIYLSMGSNTGICVTWTLNMTQ